jgi:hypothetical protein
MIILGFEIGDKIMLKKESITYSSRSGYASSFAKEVLEVISMDSKIMYTVEKGYLFRHFPIERMLEFRLATENEIKINKMKNMFVNKKSL